MVAHPSPARLVADRRDRPAGLGDRRGVLEKPPRLTPLGARLLAIGCSAPKLRGTGGAGRRLALELLGAAALSGAAMYFALQVFLEH